MSAFDDLVKRKNKCINRAPGNIAEALLWEGGAELEIILALVYAKNDEYGNAIISLTSAASCLAMRLGKKFEFRMIDAEPKETSAVAEENLRDEEKSPPEQRETSVVAAPGWPGRPPINWAEFHHADCGTKLRGCHPTACPKNRYEQSGRWDPRPIDLSKEIANDKD